MNRLCLTAALLCLALLPCPLTRAAAIAALVGSLMRTLTPKPAAPRPRRRQAEAVDYPTWVGRAERGGGCRRPSPVEAAG